MACTWSVRHEDEYAVTMYTLISCSRFGKSDDIWLGLYKQQSPNDCNKYDQGCMRHGWEWQDGTLYSYPHGWHNWHCTDHDPLSGHLCTVVKLLESDLTWFGVNCSTSKFGYICEKGMRVDVFILGYIVVEMISHS